MSKTVEVSKGAFAFCRYSLAALLWAAFFLRHSSPEIASLLLLTVTVILALSAALTVGSAPLIVLYTSTIERLAPSAKETLDIDAMRFAHTLGTLLVGVPLVLIYAGLPDTAWKILLLVAVAKTAGALGFCGASRLYTCIRSKGSCCGFMCRCDPK
jgi:hypothetical protein